MIKYKVGVPLDQTSSFCGIRPSYFRYLDWLGLEIILLPPNHTFREDLSLLLLPGGADVLTTRYGKYPKVDQGAADATKEYFDAHWLPQYIDSKIPIFGICRGHQSLNVLFGGTLVNIYHKTNDSSSPDAEMHKVYRNDTHPFSQAYKGSDFSTFASHTFGVNSRHHQGFKTSHIATEFEALFLDSGKYSNACVEAMAHKTLPIVSVQWHPEDLFDDFSSWAILNLIETRNSIIS